MRSGVAQALRPRVWHDCALFFFDLGISYFAGFGTRLGRILAVQNQLTWIQPVSTALTGDQAIWPDRLRWPYSHLYIPGSVKIYLNIIRSTMIVQVST